MSHYIVIWQYDVQPAARQQFERAYGPDGDWVTFFRQGQGYLKTDLLQDTGRPDRYVTLDYWQSAADYFAFKATYRAEYEALDQNFEPLTLSELHLGSFTRLAE